MIEVPLKRHTLCECGSALSIKLIEACAKRGAWGCIGRGSLEKCFIWKFSRYEIIVVYRYIVQLYRDTHLLIQ